MSDTYDCNIVTTFKKVAVRPPKLETRQNWLDEKENYLFARIRSLHGARAVHDAIQVYQLKMNWSSKLQVFLGITLLFKINKLMYLEWLKKTWNYKMKKQFSLSMSHQYSTQFLIMHQIIYVLRLRCKTVVFASPHKKFKFLNLVIPQFAYGRDSPKGAKFLDFVGMFIKVFQWLMCFLRWYLVFRSISWLNRSHSKLYTSIFSKESVIDVIIYFNSNNKHSAVKTPFKRFHTPKLSL